MRNPLEPLKALGVRILDRVRGATMEKKLVAVYQAGDKKYTIDETDKLWLARMVVGEGGGDASDQKIRALLWAILQRFMLLNPYRSWGSLSKVIRAFAQPVNPIWDGVQDSNDGGRQDRCAPGGDKRGTEYCKPETIARRERITALSWEKIPLRIREAVLAFQRGELPYPSGITQRINNWASYSSVRRLYPWGVDVDGDWFLEDEGTLKMDVMVNEKIWREITSAGFITKNLLVGLTIGGALGAIGYIVARKVM